VTLTAWDLHGAEFLEEKEIWLLNWSAMIDIKDSNHNTEVRTNCKYH
jgi:hypothetical protein